MNLRRLLLPLSPLYGGVTSLRNKFFDWGIYASKSYDLPIISVGNITVGGTGKTPLTEYIIRLFEAQTEQIALLSRGYKRATKGALLANEKSTVADIGDEPYQILQKFKHLKVAVAEKRVKGMQLLLNTNTSLVLMDDAYQHRYVKPGFSLLVVDYNRPLWKDVPFPAGHLRETEAGKKRANLIVVNKCPDHLSTQEKEHWIKKLNPGDDQKVFFSRIKYGYPQSFVLDQILVPTSCIGLAGIARPEIFKTHLEKNYPVKDFLSFSDHHNFSEKDIENIASSAQKHQADFVITTEKDAVRLMNLDFIPLKLKEKIIYIPIELEFLFNEKNNFDEILLEYVRNHSKNS